MAVKYDIVLINDDREQQATFFFDGLLETFIVIRGDWWD
jgi:hypothetical protein